MGSWLRRLRGALGNAVTWAVAWGGVGAALGLYFGIGALPMGVSIWQAIVGTAASLAAAGFVAGGSFAVVLGVMERNHTLADLRVPRLALWGAVAGMLVPTVQLLVSGFPGGMTTAMIVMGITGLMGAGCSAGSLALARRADRAELGDGSLKELEP